MPVILDPLVRTDFSTDIEKCGKIQAWMAVMNSNLTLEESIIIPMVDISKADCALGQKPVPVYNRPWSRLGVARSATSFICV